MRICIQDQCEKKHDSRGYCANHARQVRKYGHVLTAQEKFLHRSVARSAAMKKYYEDNPVRKKRHWAEEKRIAAKGVTKNTGRTHFKKGVSPWNKDTIGLVTAWNKGIKTGLIPWNKGKTGLMPRPHNKIGDGITAANKLERKKFAKQMRSTIFERDDYTCQVCESRGGNLQVDHIKRWSEYPELRFNEENCRTVCMACHYYITFKRKLPEGVIWGHNLNRRIES